MKNPDLSAVASRDKDSVQGHLRGSAGVGNKGETADLDPEPSRNLREKMESFMSESGCRRVCIYYDRMNLGGHTALRIEIVDKDSLITTELAGDQAAAFYHRLTGDDGFLLCAAETETQ